MYINKCFHIMANYLMSVNYKLPFLLIILLLWYNLNSRSFVCMLYNNYFRGTYQKLSLYKKVYSHRRAFSRFFFSRLKSALFPIYFYLCNLYDRVFPSMHKFITNECQCEFISGFDNKYFCALNLFRF